MGVNLQGGKVGSKKNSLSEILFLCYFNSMASKLFNSCPLPYNTVVIMEGQELNCLDAIKKRYPKNKILVSEDLLTHPLPYP